MRAEPIKIVIAALGGQGGGVLSDWIVAAAEKAGFMAQATSVPGVAQRTGATVYYLELFPESLARERRMEPVLALMPTQGDVDIVIAAELMEAGRAMLRGFVSKDSTLIVSSHRDYAIGEKIALGEGRKDPEAVIAAAQASAGRLILADMAQAARTAGAPLSAALFGALAGSRALPFAPAVFEEAIREGRSAEANLRGFAAGSALADAAARRSQAEAETSGSGERTAAIAVGEGGDRRGDDLRSRLQAFPPETHEVLTEGLKRAADYQDRRYAALYLDRMAAIARLDAACVGRRGNSRLTRDAARHLALWMTYEDAIRVADLKTRASRFSRVRDDVKADPGRILNLSEYFHPRAEEVCDLLPPFLARAVLASPRRRRILGALLGGGRRVSTTKLRGFLPLYFLAMLRPIRRRSYRFHVETRRISDWLSLIESEAPSDYALACAIADLPRLLKGYGDTHERGLARFNRIREAMNEIKAAPDPAGALADLIDAALKDEEGRAFSAALAGLKGAPEDDAPRALAIPT